MANVRRSLSKVTGYKMVEARTEQFVSDLKQIHQNIYDFEFDCHQVSQMIESKCENCEINVQICTYLVEYKKEIDLLAPFSYFVNCALKIFSLAHAAAFAPMASTNVYDYYRKRGVKARASLMYLPKMIKKFHYDSKNFTNIIMNDPAYASPSTRLTIYKEKYTNCLQIGEEYQPGAKNALNVFFKHRLLMRNQLIVRIFAEKVIDYMISANEVISVSSTELNTSEESVNEEEEEEEEEESEEEGEGEAGSG
ncbi:unnamed protein product [Hymenolepis diminuta]|uniref:Uncharacterized protein n=1 Tax=Hymenolepis diminuta TaxID=6216 RepID=A0A564YQD0_HYMDI|nr:unnamed protein product [Hymenolepis diminuta]